MASGGIPVPAPVNISGNAVENWRFFKSQWENYEIATENDKKPAKECVSRMMQAIFLGWVVRYYTGGAKDCVGGEWPLPSYFGDQMACISELQCYLAAGGVCVATALYVLPYHPYLYGMQEAGMGLRIACSTMLYKKALRLSRSALAETTVGQMINLLSNDVNKFDDGLSHVPYLLVGPLQAVVATVILWQHLGVSCLAGIAVIAFYIPFQSVMAKVFSKLRVKVTALTDERIRLMNETVAGMRVIKMYTWEEPFVKLIADARRREVKKVRSTAFLRGLNMSLFYVSSSLTLLLAFLVFSLLSDEPLTPEITFVSLTLFTSLKLSMTLFFPYGVSQGAESVVSLKRLQRFLLLDEQTASNHIDTSDLRPQPDQCGIWLNDVIGRWNLSVEEPTLGSISATVAPGELLAVVGSVGAGKSSLLMSVLGELPLSGGTIKVRGKIAYASQEPWIFSGDVRSNVLFGNEYDEAKYQKVLHACALDKDIIQLPYGDRTLVGERGVSLSGGQKARVNLARALYLDADIYLLDDPLSAVDTAVAKHLFEKCINGYLKNKTRVLVTHQLQFIKSATQIMVLKEGKRIAYGSYPELVELGVDLVTTVESTGVKGQESNSTSGKHTSVSSSTSDNRDADQRSLSLSSDLDMDTDEFTPLDQHHNEGAPTQEEETRISGSIESGTYWKYIRAGGGPIFLSLLFLSNWLCQIIFNGSDFWLSTWSAYMSQVDQPEVNGTCERASGVGVWFFKGLVDCPDTWFFVYIYTAMVVLLFVLSMTRSVFFFVMCTRSSQALHDRMFASIVRVPITFFDNNPIGRILNRFTKDMGTIDDWIPMTALDMVVIFFGLIGNLVLAAIVEPYLILPASVLVFLFFMARRLYLVTTRDLKRIEAITRSPVFSHISTSLHGLTTIRASKAQSMFVNNFYALQDRHSRVWFTIVGGTRWLGIILDWICVVYITVVTAVLVSTARNPGESGNVGLVISTALMLCGSFQWGIKQSVEIENQMTSVERVVEYSNLKPEAELEAPPGRKPPKEWPHEGRITFHKMSLTYLPEDPPVLKNITCLIKPMEKVGIVGRTGAGKSSMISALFRMCEPDGIIDIDGISIKSIGLHDLRSRISIIPQDPVLFTGPVRLNIDPFGQKDDTLIWNVLEEVQLKDAVSQLPGGLDTLLSEGGSNFSVGQRQLFCMARAIIRNNRILVLDEATANVDSRTDALIQKMIREKFTECTVLTIAHRLNTIMDSDRVLVLDAGQIQEFDKPYALLQNENSSLYKMVQKTGLSMAAQLFENARLSSESRNNSDENSKSPMYPHSRRNSQRKSSLKTHLDSISEIENATMNPLIGTLGSGTQETEESRRSVEVNPEDLEESPEVLLTPSDGSESEDHNNTELSMVKLK